MTLCDVDVLWDCLCPTGEQHGLAVSIRSISRHEGLLFFFLSISFFPCARHFVRHFGYGSWTSLALSKLRAVEKKDQLQIILICSLLCPLQGRNDAQRCYATYSNHMQLGPELLLTMALSMTWMITPWTIQKLGTWRLPFWLPFMFFPLCFLPLEPCMLPLDRGKCKNTVKHWYFHTKRRVCKAFNYGGCLGNANNFSNREDCMTACLSTGKTHTLGNLRALSNEK